jgi:hypothetical protein
MVVLLSDAYSLRQLTLQALPPPTYTQTRLSVYIPAITGFVGVIKVSLFFLVAGTSRDSSEVFPMANALLQCDVPRVEIVQRARKFHKGPRR